MSGFSQKTREAIYERAGYCCERCHRYARGGSIHHRRPRGMGGNKTLATNLPSNGLLLCDGPAAPNGGCHRWVEKNRLEALDLGLLVRQGVDPGSVPVHLHIGVVYLTDDACYDFAPALGVTP